MNATRKIYEALKAKREDDGAAVITAVDVAKLIRHRLKTVWPAVKFSVRCDGYDCVNVGWTDGPTQRAVQAEIDAYEFGGFDGSIDLAYSADNWLHPDGRMEAAASRGTEGSMGAVAGYVSDCPKPGAILVKYGPKYIFANRTESPEHMAALALRAAAHYGIEYDTSRAAWDQHHNGDSLAHLALVLEERACENKSAFLPK